MGYFETLSTPVAVTGGNVLLVIIAAIWVVLAIVIAAATFFPKLTSSDAESETPDKIDVSEDAKLDIDSIEIAEIADGPTAVVASDATESVQLTKEELEEIELDEPLSPESSEAESSSSPGQEPAPASWFDEEDEIKVESSQDAESDQSVSPEETEPEISLNEIMNEIKLPRKVKIADDQNVTDARAYFAKGQEALDVGSRFADELERIGFEIEPVGHSEARAVRGDVALMMAITPENAELTQDGAKLYPKVADDAVVVQIWVDPADS